MERAQLLKQINTFLEQGPFADEEVEMWKEKAPKMSLDQLEELFNLLEEKQKILTDTNDLFIKIADEVAAERDKSLAKIPNSVSVVDMDASSVEKIFKSGLLKFLLDENYDIFNELNLHLDNARIVGNNVVEEAEDLIKALHANEEKFSSNSKETIGEWLNLYNSFSDKLDRKSIDRLNFITNHERAKVLDKNTKEILLKLLKLYDFLLNPANVETELEKLKEIEKVRRVSGPPKTEGEKRIEELEEAKKRLTDDSLEKKVIEEAGIQGERRIEDLKFLAGQHKEGSLERKAIDEEIRKLEKQVRSKK